VSRHEFAIQIHFHPMNAEPNVHGFAAMPVGNAIGLRFEPHVIIRPHLGFLPLGELIPASGQSLQLGLFLRLEELPPGKRHVA
jgi:hypothetical protein